MQATATLELSKKTVKKSVQTKGAGQDFLLLCSLAPHDGRVMDAIQALYYLPKNFKLTVLSGTRQSREKVAGWMKIMSLKGRVTFRETGMVHGTSPFLYIYDERDKARSVKAPFVVVTDALVNGGIENNGRRGFTVSADSPEALASAILRIARAKQAA